MKTYPIADYTPDLYKYHGNVRAIKTGEYRIPLKGEWYLSGAIIEAHKAFNDLTYPFHIAKLVLTETITTIKIIKEL